MLGCNVRCFHRIWWETWYGWPPCILFCRTLSARTPRHPSTQHRFILWFAMSWCFSFDKQGPLEYQHLWPRCIHFLVWFFLTWTFRFCLSLSVHYGLALPKGWHQVNWEDSLKDHRNSHLTRLPSLTIEPSWYLSPSWTAEFSLIFLGFLPWSKGSYVSRMFTYQFSKCTNFHLPPPSSIAHHPKKAYHYRLHLSLGSSCCLPMSFSLDK